MLNISLEEALEAAEAQTEFANEATKDGRGRKEGVGTARGRKRRGGKCCRERSEGANERVEIPSFLPSIHELLVGKRYPSHLLFTGWQWAYVKIHPDKKLTYVRPFASQSIGGGQRVNIFLWFLEVCFLPSSRMYSRSANN